MTTGQDKFVRLIAGAALLLAFRSEAVSATAIFAVTKAGTVYTSTDGAATWKPVTIPDMPVGTYGSWMGTDPNGNIYLALSIAVVGKGRPVATDSNPGRAILRSYDGGQTWSAVPFPDTLSMHLVVDPTASNALYGIASGGVVRSTDGGSTFTSATLGLGAVGIGADPQQPGVVYATAAQQDRTFAVFKSTDYGSTWTSLGTPAGKTVAWAPTDVAVDPRNSKNLYLPASGPCATGVTNCGLYHSTDGGKTWAPANIAGSFYSVRFDAKSGTVYASGVLLPGATQKAQTGEVIRSTDGGNTWTTLNTGFSTYAIDMYLDPNASSTMYAAPVAGNGVSPGGVFVTTNGGGSWKLNAVAPQIAPNDIITSMGVIGGAPPPKPTVSVATTVSAASLQAGPVAAESIVVATGSHIATGTATADYDQPPMTLAGSTISVTDSAGVTRLAVIFSISDTQVTYQIPPGTAAGPATVAITAGDGATGTFQIQVASVAPGLFTLNSAALVRAYVLRVSNGIQFVEDVYDIDATGALIARPITVSNGDQVYLIAYGTGFRAAGGDIGATVGRVSAPILYAGPQGIRPGMDQFNIVIPPEVATGAPQVVPIVLTAAGQTANTVYVTVQ